MEVISAWLTPGRFALGLGILVFLRFAEVIVGDGAFVTLDFSQFGYGLAQHQRLNFWRGELPLWNPLSSCGIPFLAQWNTMVLYPGALFYLLFPLQWSLSVFCVLHLYLGGLGVYFLVRRQVGDNLAGAVGGMIFAFNGFMQACLMWPNNIAALGWLPWVFLAGISAWQVGGRKLLLAVSVGGLQMLTGAPEVILVTWLLLAGYFLLDLWRYREVAPAEVRVRAIRFGGMVGLIALLAAAQLLPFLDLLAHSPRQADGQPVDWPMSTVAWIRFLMPLFHTTLRSTGLFKPVDQGWIHSYYLGAVAVTLVAIALLAVRRPSVWLMGGAVLVAGLLAIGNNLFLYPLAAKILPLGFIRYPVKFLIFSAALLPLLAAVGMRGLTVARDEEGRRRVMIGAMIGGVVTVMSYLLIGQYPHPDADPDLAKSNGGERIFLALLIAALGVGLVRCATFRVARLMAAGFFLLLWLDYSRFQPAIMLTMPRENYTRITPALENVNSDFKAGYTRMGLLGGTHYENTFRNDASGGDIHMRAWLDQFSNLNLLNQVRKFDGFFALWFREHDELEHVLHTWKRYDLRPGLADFLGIAYMTTRGNPFEWTPRPSARRIITAGPAPVFEGPTNAIVRLSVPEFDSSAVVSLRPEAEGVVKVRERTDASVEIEEMGAHVISFTVTAAAPTMAVIAQCHYHPWRATVDDESTPIWRANHAFQAVEVPAGTHRVVLRYVDTKFRIGVALSVTAIFLIGLLWWRWGPQSPVTKNE